MDQSLIDVEAKSAGEHSLFTNGYLSLRNSVNTLSKVRLSQGDEEVSDAINGRNSLIGIPEDTPVLSFVDPNQNLVGQAAVWERRTWEDLGKFRSAVENTQFLSQEAREHALKYVESMEENLGIPDHIKETDYILKKINSK